MTPQLAGLSLCVLLPALGISIANVALPTLAQAFDASFAEIQLVVLAYLVANTAFIVFAGRLGDVAGRRRVLLVGIWIFAAASALCGVAPWLWMLDTARAIQGVGAAIMMALAMALVADAVPAQRIGSAMGLLGTMSAIGTTLGPLLGGVLTASLGWRAVFLVNVPVALVAIFLVRRSMPADRPAAPAKHGLTKIARDPALAGALLTTALVATVMMATLIVGPFYLAHALGLGAAAVGLVMSAGPAVAALTGLPAGRIVDRFGAARASIVGLAGMVAGCAGLGLSPVAWGVWGYVVPLVVLTGNYALFQAANNTAVMKDVAREQRGVVGGALSLARNAGFIVGASAMGAIYADSGMRVTFAVAAVLAGFALAIAVTRSAPGNSGLA